MSRRLLILLCCLACYQAFAQPRLEVVLQKGHSDNNFNYPSIIAISHDNRWVVTFRNKDKEMIIWSLATSKIYAAYTLDITISTAEFLGNNEDLLLNHSHVLNIHSGKMQSLPSSASHPLQWKIKYDYSFSQHKYTKRIAWSVTPPDFTDTLKQKFSLFAHDKKNNRCWVASEESLYEYDLATRQALPLHPGLGKISRLYWDSLPRILIVEGYQNAVLFRGTLASDKFTIKGQVLNITVSPGGKWVAGLDVEKKPAALKIWKINNSNTPELQFTLSDFKGYSGEHAWFNSDSTVLLYAKKEEANGLTSYKAKLLQLPSLRTIWEEKETAVQYECAGKGRYLIAIYAEEDKVVDLSTGRYVQVNNATLQKVQISADEEYLLAKFKQDNQYRYGALYRLPGLEPVNETMGDSAINRFSKYSIYPDPKFLFDQNGKNIIAYYNSNRLLFYDIATGNWKQDSLVTGGVSISNLEYDATGKYFLVQRGFYQDPFVFDAATLQPLKKEDTLVRVISFTAGRGSRLFSLYRKNFENHILRVQAVPGGSTTELPLIGYLQAIHTSRQGDSLAYITMRLHQYRNEEGFLRTEKIYTARLLSVSGFRLLDSVRLPNEVAEKSDKFQLYFSKTGQQIYIGCLGLYRWDLRQQSLTKISLSKTGYYFPVAENSTGSSLLGYRANEKRDSSAIVSLSLQNGEVKQLAPSDLDAYYLDGISNIYLKSYADQFNLKIDYKNYYINTRQPDLRVQGPVNAELYNPVFTPNGKQVLQLSTVYGLDVYDAAAFLPLSGIRPYRFSTIGFTANRKYAVQPGFGSELLKVYEVANGFRKIPIFTSNGPDSPYYFFNKYNVYADQLMHLSRNGNWLYTLDCRGENIVRVFEFPSGKLVYEDKGAHLRPVKNKNYQPGRLDQEDFSLTSISMSDDETTLLYETAQPYLVKAKVSAGKKQLLSFKKQDLFNIILSETGRYAAALNSQPENNSLKDSLISWDEAGKRSAIAAGTSLLSSWSAIRMEILEKENILLLFRPDRVQVYQLPQLTLLKTFVEPTMIAAGTEEAVLIINAAGKTRQAYQLPSLQPVPPPVKKETYSFTYTNGLQRIMKDSTELASFVFDETNEEMLFFTPGNYYAVSKASAEAIAFRYNGELYPASVFDVLYNRPDTVFRLLQPVFHFREDLLSLYKKAGEIRQQRYPFRRSAGRLDALPVVSISNSEQVTVTTERNVSLSCSGASKAAPLSALRIFVNGVPYGGHKGFAIQGSDYKTTLTIPLSPGRNEIRLMATTADGLSSLPATTVVYYQPAEKRQPLTRFIGIGIAAYADTNYNLKYAAKDIRDFTRLLRSKTKQLQVDTLLNEKATRENILALKNNLHSLQPEDRVILLFAGHGLRNSRNEYFLAPHNMDFENPEQKGISAEELYSLLDSIAPRQRLILLDACNSGELFSTDTSLAEGVYGTRAEKEVQTVPGGRGIILDSASNSSGQSVADIMEEVFADYSNSYGIDVVAATKGTELAWETPALKNGVFTYALIKVLQGFSAVNTKERRVPAVSDLLRNVSPMVFKITAGKQKPVTRSQNTAADWELW